MKTANKNHCCPYCGSDNIRIQAAPLINVTLDDEGLCDSIDCHYSDLLKSVNEELGPEDFAIQCLDCGEDCDILFNGNGGWKLVKCEDSFSVFDKKYQLLYRYQIDKKRKGDA